MFGKQDALDVIVVGGGGSGLAAALRAAERGARVLLLEKQPNLGGTTGIAIGSFTASNTVLQRKAEIADDPDAHEVDAGQFAPPDIEAVCNRPLRRYFLGEASRTLDWLLALGLTFHGPSPEPPNRVARMHNVVPNAKAYIATFQARLLRLGGKIVCSAPVERLLRDGDRVVGVEVAVAGLRCEFRARRGVVLAAGDYSNSPELIGRYKGARFTAIEGINPHSHGDGHQLAQSCGGQLVNMEVTYGPELRFLTPPGKTFEQLLPAQGFAARMVGRLLPWVPKSVINWRIKRLLLTWQHPENRLFDDGAILINQAGQRFCDETVWPDREIAIANQPHKVAYIVLDARLVERYSRWPHFISTAPEIAYAYVDDYLKRRSDVTVQRSTVEELAVVRNIPVIPLRQTVDQYNRAAMDETPDPCGRQLGRVPLQGSRWVLLGPAKAYFTTTEGGVAVNRELQVLDGQGQPILGLYAVGSNGLGGQILWGHGLHIAWAITSGRLVGEHLSSPE